MTRRLKMRFLVKCAIGSGSGAASWQHAVTKQKRRVKQSESAGIRRTPNAGASFLGKRVARRVWSAAYPGAFFSQRNINDVAQLSLSISNPPTETEVEGSRDKMKELVGAM
jgi:hypothetical protein